MKAGDRYGMLTAVRKYDVTDYGSARWVFRCDCGTEFVAHVNNVLSGNTRSCGCIRSELARGAWKRHIEKSSNSLEFFLKNQ